MMHNSPLPPPITGTALAKTTRPVLGVVAPRERLFAKLDGTPARNVMWIAGPPGSGKTTLAASYVEARGLSSLWYQVDADDDDAATLFHYLAHAARKIEGVDLDRLPHFDRDGGTDIRAFSRDFFRRLMTGARPPFALVFDNLQGLPAGSSLATVLEAALSQVPKGSCIIITSRTEPPSAFARLRVSGQMICLDATQLRIDIEELGRIAALRGHALDGTALAQLHERTNGWAAGLVLMLEHAKLAGHLADLPDDAVPEVIFDYLAGEIFDRFDNKTQRFMLALACLPRMNASIAQSLAGEDKAARLLVNLSLNNFFLSEAGSAEGRSYRFHPLMRDFLRNRAARDAPDMLAPKHLQQAAELLGAAGYAEDAAALCVEARNWNQLARLAAKEADSLLEQGRHEMLAMWLESLPGEVLRDFPELLMAFAVCRAGASPRAACRLFEEAYEAFKTRHDVPRMATCCRGAIDAIVDDFDDLAALDRWCAELIGLMRNEATSVPTGCDASLARALLLRSARYTDLETCFGRNAAGTERAVAAALRGEPAAADLALLGQRDDRADPAREPQERLGACLVHWLAGDHSAALAGARQDLQAQASGAARGQTAWMRAIAAAAALGASNQEAARNELLRLDATGAELRRGDRAILHYLRGWLADMDGDSPGALREARSAVALAAEAGLGWCECLARLALARLLASSGDQRGAGLHLRVAQGLAENAGNAITGFALHMASAEIALEAEPGATGALSAAFAFGRENGLHDTPWWRPRRVAALCVLALASDIEAGYARELVRARALVPDVAPLRVPSWPWAFRITTFGDFRLFKEDRAIEFSGKGPGRPAELLKVLLAQGGQNVRADQLADALWPNAEADYAHKSFTAALHRLRRLLGDDAAVILRDSRLSLNPALVWTDGWALEQTLDDMEHAVRSARPQHPPEALPGLVDTAFAVYKGPYLEDESEQPAYIACREQARARLLRCLARVARLWEDAGAHQSAADCLQRLIDADPLFEAPYRHLMLHFKRRGEPMEARAVYERLRGTLAMRLKMLPSADSQAVYAELVAP